MLLEEEHHVRLDGKPGRRRRRRRAAGSELLEQRGELAVGHVLPALLRVQQLAVGVLEPALLLRLPEPQAFLAARRRLDLHDERSLEALFGDVRSGRQRGHGGGAALIARFHCCGAACVAAAGTGTRSRSRSPSCSAAQL